MLMAGYAHSIILPVQLEAATAASDTAVGTEHAVLAGTLAGKEPSGNWIVL